jgi:hypothetical protein
MRTPLFLLAGLLLVGASFILGKLFLETYPKAGTWATYLFMLVWLVLAASNLVAGVTRAGYTVAEELPIFLLIFGLPTVCMLLLRWKLFWAATSQRSSALQQSEANVQIAVLTFDGYNELDSFIAAGILNRVEARDWAAYITSPTPEVTSRYGVTVQRQRPLEFAAEADAVIIGSGAKTREIAADPHMLSRIVLDPSRQLISPYRDVSVYLPPGWRPMGQRYGYFFLMLLSALLGIRAPPATAFPVSVTVDASKRLVTCRRSGDSSERMSPITGLGQTARSCGWS